jgi:hypothetical protein
MGATFARPRHAQTRHHGRHIVSASRSGDPRAATAPLTLPIRPVPNYRNSYQSAVEAEEADRTKDFG